MSQASSSTTSAKQSPAEKAKKFREKTKLLEQERKSKLSHLEKCKQHYLKQLRMIEDNNQVLHEYYEFLKRIFLNQDHILQFLSDRNINNRIVLRVSENVQQILRNLDRNECHFPIISPLEIPSSDDVFTPDQSPDLTAFSGEDEETEAVRKSLELVCQVLEEAPIDIVDFDMESILEYETL